MKYLIFLSILFCSCVPKYSIREKDKAVVITNQSGSVSCLAGHGCCFPYRHHKDIHGCTVMVCIDEKIAPKKVAEESFPIGEIDGFVQVYYDETEIFR